MANGTTPLHPIGSTYFAELPNASDAYVNVVNSVNWCGPVAGTFIGCAFQNSKNGLIIDRASAVGGAAGILIAHEFGHTTNAITNASTNYHDNQGRQIMDQFIADNNTMVRQTATCTRFRYDFGPQCPPNGDNSSTAPAICSSTGGPGLAAPPAADDEPSANDEERSFVDVPIEELASSLVLVDAIPTNLPDYYGRSDVEALRRILDVAGDRQRTVLALIGLISDDAEADINRLLEHSESRGADVSGALMAVGYIIARTGYDVGIDRLVEKLNSDDEPTYEAAALGLAVSGNPRALAALEARAPAKFDPYNILSVAPGENRKVAELGLDGYYAQPFKWEQFEPLPGGIAGVE